MRALLAVLLFAAPSAYAAPCSGPEHRQFDFWIGRWQVEDAKGKVKGTNLIARVGDCAITEEWSGADGLVGRSVTGFDAARRLWHQTWVDSEGSVLVSEGGMHDGHMRLSSPRDRQTWTVQPDGTIQQVWERSKDGGKTWAVVMDLRYRRLGS
jgi:hypothetical protein